MQMLDDRQWIEIFCGRMLISLFDSFRFTKGKWFIFGQKINEIIVKEIFAGMTAEHMTKFQELCYVTFETNQ